MEYIKIKKIIHIILWGGVTLPLLIIYYLQDKSVKEFIESDIEEMNKRLNVNQSLGFYLFFYKAYRNLFYYRVNNNIFLQLLKYVYRPYPQFFIKASYIGKYCFVLNHPYSTIINCNYIGDHFTVCHLSTIGNKQHGRNDLIPTIGNNVVLGANVSILGDIRIGDNVIIGAGSVVVSDIPDNSIAVGNPARVIKKHNMHQYVNTKYGFDK